MFEHSDLDTIFWSALRDKKDRGRGGGREGGTNVNQCGFTMLW